MRVLWNLDPVKEILFQPVLTVGNFDGVHLGHQAILRETIRLARAMNRSPVVFTFEPHPQKVLKRDEAPPLLTTLPQKIRLLESLGIEASIVCPFDEKVYQYTPDQFFSEILVARVEPAHLVEGEDFTFGKGRTGSPELLKRLGREHGVGVTVMDSVIFEGETISSTRVRACIREGNVAKARSLLGRPYAVEGTRIRGKGRGRTLGYPTVNLTPESELLPAIGIYAVQVELDQRLFLGAASLGFNPTFGGNHFSFEVYLLDFKGDMMDKEVRVLFYKRLREEIRFDSGEELIHQMETDVAQVKEIFRGERP